MDMTERGIYITLLAYQWAHNSIPKKRVGFIIGQSWESLTNEVKNKFSDNGETLVNTRLEEERQKRAAFKKKQSENGKRGGRPSKNKKPNKSQTQSQKKPLEDESENESENRKGKRRGESELVYPFDDAKFLEMWQTWKRYKREEHKFKYASLVSEQGALSKLANMANGSSQTAIAIILQSIENGWKGFFDLKKQNNGQSKLDPAAIAIDIIKKRGLA